MPRPTQHGDIESPPVLKPDPLALATRDMDTAVRAAPEASESRSPAPRPSPSRSRVANSGRSTRSLLLSLLSASSAAMAETCVPLKGSTTCKAFASSSISTDTTLVKLFPFLQYVSDVGSFDEQLRSYVSTSYVQTKYQTLLGCSGISLTNTSNLYARFTTTVICNAIIQNSIDPCSLSADESRPVCAESCAQFAESEEYVISDSDACKSPSSGAGSQIRADFTNCALPANALSSGTCVQGITNEPENCGYGNSTLGLCAYCGSGGINSTDTCCYNADADTRCAGVVLPSLTQTITFSTPLPTSTSSATSTAMASSGNKLSGGAIAGIVIGSVLGFLLIALGVVLCILSRRRQRGSQHGSIFNQPSPARQGPTAQAHAAAPMSSAAPQGYEVLPGGRIARMSALEGHSGESPSHGRSLGAVSAMAAGAGGYAAGSSSRRRDDQSSSEGFGSSPDRSELGVTGVLRPPPTSRRQGSLSSSSVLAGDDGRSPSSAGGMSSPQGVASQQSEQLPFFKDYYSQDDIHPGDRVAVLWAYQPRANDEFSLERGDMLKVVGIWDDGWATGIMVDENAEEWESRRQAQRDSGVSNTSGRAQEPSPPVSGEIKAFPLVCVCLPEHWRKTIEGDSSTDAGSSAFHPGTSAAGL